MDTSATTPPPARAEYVVAGGLVVGAAGIAILVLVGYVPRAAVMGVLALPVLALIGLLGSRLSWMPAVAVPFATFGLFGAVAAGGLDVLMGRIAGADGVAVLVATGLQLIGLAAADVAAVVATVGNYRDRGDR